jgi:hypothetical protein
MILLWKSSKLIGARNSVPSGEARLLSTFGRPAMLGGRSLVRELLLWLESLAESRDDFPERRKEVDGFLHRGRVRIAEERPE